jgi:hypothetical protein
MSVYCDNLLIVGVITNRITGIMSPSNPTPGLKRGSWYSPSIFRNFAKANPSLA